MNFVKDGSATKKNNNNKKNKDRERESCNVSAALEGWPTSLSF